MLFTLRAAVDNYHQERARFAGPHPTAGCSCTFCNVVRAADMLASTALAEPAIPRWIRRLPPDPGRRMRN